MSYFVNSTEHLGEPSLQNLSAIN